MEGLSALRRKRQMHKVQTQAGVKARHGGKRPGGRLIAGHKEPADVHTLLQEDAQPNLRVWQMWDEACGFEGVLDHFRHNLTKFEAATDEFLTRLEPVLRAPLPRVWDAVEGGLAEPTRATISHGHSHTVGGDASIAGLEEARSDFHNRLRGHVLRPLHQWSEALSVVEERLPELSRLRAEVIKHSRAAARSSRRYKETAGTMGTPGVGGPETGAIVPHRGGSGGGGIGAVFGACGRPRAGHGSRGGGRGYGDDDYSSSSSDDDDCPRETGADRQARREREVEEAGLKMNFKHRQLMAARADYAEAEKLLADQLSGLQRDAAWTKSYVVSSLMLTMEAMQTAVVSLGNTKQPLPGFTERSSLPPERHGQLCDNISLVAGMPRHLRYEVFDEGATPALPSTVHAHKATAQPMELAARPDVAPLDRVHTAATGAAAIPAAMLPGGPPPRAAQPLVDSPAPSVLSSEMSAGHMHGAPALGGRRDVMSDASATYRDGSSVSSGGAGASPLRMSETDTMPAPSAMHTASTGSAGTYATPGALGSTYAAGQVSVAREGVREEVCGRKTFTQVEDRPVTRERVETIVEHRPVEKQYVTEVRFEGETPLAGHAEVVGAQQRIVSVAEPGPRCPQGVCAPGAACTHLDTAGARRTQRAGSSSSSSSSSSSGDEAEGGHRRRRGARVLNGAGGAGATGAAGAGTTALGTSRDEGTGVGVGEREHEHRSGGGVLSGLRDKLTGAATAEPAGVSETAPTQRAMVA